MKRTLIYSLVLAGMLGSCVKDEGVYNFLTDGMHLNSVSIKNLDDQYDVGLAFIDELEIAPKVEGSVYGDDESHYEYTWYRCRGSHVHDTLSNERVLKCRADFYPGAHVLYFVVRDKDTGVERNASTTIRTSSPFTRGYMVAGNRPGTNRAAIDMLSMIKKTSESDTVYVKNVLNEENAELFNLRDLIYTGYYSAVYERFMLVTDDNSYQMSFSSDAGLTVLGDPVSLGNISCALPHKTPFKVLDIGARQGVQQTGAGSIYPRFYMTEDLCFMVNVTEGMDYMFEPVNRYNVNSEDLFRFYPKFFYNTRKRNLSYTSMSNSPCLVYDLDNECFCYFTNVSNQKYALNIVDQPSNGVTLNNRNRNYTLVYGENDYAATNGRINAIVKHKTQEKYILCQFSVQFPSWGSGLSIQGSEKDIDLSIAENFQQAERFYFDGWASQMMYSVGNTLYVYDYVNKRLAKETFDAPITCLQSAIMPGGNNYNQYWVGTFDGTKGKIYKMATDSNQNATEIFHEDNQEWEVDMEPVKILFSNRGAGMG